MANAQAAYRALLPVARVFEAQHQMPALVDIFTYVANDLWQSGEYDRHVDSAASFVRRLEPDFQQGSEVGILPRHAPLLVETSGVIRWRRGGTWQELSLGRGVCEVLGDRVLIAAARQALTRRGRQPHGGPEQVLWRHGPALRPGHAIDAASRDVLIGDAGIA